VSKKVFRVFVWVSLGGRSKKERDEEIDEREMRRAMRRAMRKRCFLVGTDKKGRDEERELVSWVGF
jgi:hypothetical protein